VNDSYRERLKAIELAIANYNAMIRTLKKQMQEGAANSWAFHQALVRYQRWREDLDVQLGLERVY
jgi:outer membrane protein TolC